MINVAGKFELDNTDIVLTGGMRACNLLWNFTGSAISESNEVELENGSNAVGIFLALSRLVDLESGASLSGQILAGGDLELWSSSVSLPAADCGDDGRLRSRSRSTASSSRRARR